MHNAGSDVTSSIIFYTLIFDISVLGSNENHGGQPINGTDMASSQGDAQDDTGRASLS